MQLQLIGTIVLVSLVITMQNSPYVSEVPDGRMVLRFSKGAHHVGMHVVHVGWMNHIPSPWKKLLPHRTTIAPNHDC